MRKSRLNPLNLFIPCHFDWLRQPARERLAFRWCLLVPGVRQRLPERHLDHGEVRRYLTGVKTAISTKGQIVLPVAIREQDGIEPGQEFELERIDRGEYRLTRLSSRANEGVVDWLLACPQKGFFTPIESESTDDL